MRALSIITALALASTFTQCWADIPHLSEEYPYIFNKLKEKYCLSQSTLISTDVLVLGSERCLDSVDSSCCENLKEALGTTRSLTLIGDNSFVSGFMRTINTNFPPFILGNLNPLGGINRVGITPYTTKTSECTYFTRSLKVDVIFGSTDAKDVLKNYINTIVIGNTTLNSFTTGGNLNDLYYGMYYSLHPSTIKQTKYPDWINKNADIKELDVNSEVEQFQLEQDWCNHVLTAPPPPPTPLNSSNFNSVTASNITNKLAHEICDGNNSIHFVKVFDDYGDKNASEWCNECTAGNAIKQPGSNCSSTNTGAIYIDHYTPYRQLANDPGTTTDCSSARPVHLFDGSGFYDNTTLYPYFSVTSIAENRTCDDFESFFEPDIPVFIQLYDSNINTLQYSQCQNDSITSFFTMEAAGVDLICNNVQLTLEDVAVTANDFLVNFFQENFCYKDGIENDKVCIKQSFDNETICDTCWLESYRPDGCDYRNNTGEIQLQGVLDGQIQTNNCYRTSQNICNNLNNNVRFLYASEGYADDVDRFPYLEFEFSNNDADNCHMTGGVLDKTTIQNVFLQTKDNLDNTIPPYKQCEALPGTQNKQIYYIPEKYDLWCQYDFSRETEIERGTQLFKNIQKNLCSNEDTALFLAGGPFTNQTECEDAKSIVTSGTTWDSSQYDDFHSLKLYFSLNTTDSGEKSCSQVDPSFIKRFDITNLNLPEKLYIFDADVNSGFLHDQYRFSHVQTDYFLDFINTTDICEGYSPNPLTNYLEVWSNVSNNICGDDDFVVIAYQFEYVNNCTEIFEYIDANPVNFTLLSNYHTHLDFEKPHTQTFNSCNEKNYSGINRTLYFKNISIDLFENISISIDVGALNNHNPRITFEPTNKPEWTYHDNTYTGDYYLHNGAELCNGNNPEPTTTTTTTPTSSSTQTTSSSDPTPTPTPTHSSTQTISSSTQTTSSSDPTPTPTPTHSSTQTTSSSDPTPTSTSTPTSTPTTTTTPSPTLTPTPNTNVQRENLTVLHNSNLYEGGFAATISFIICGVGLLAVAIPVGIRFS
jgi:hypothetical protein